MNRRNVGKEAASIFNSSLKAGIETVQKGRMGQTRLLDSMRTTGRCLQKQILYVLATLFANLYAGKQNS